MAMNGVFVILFILVVSSIFVLFSLGGSESNNHLYSEKGIYDMYNTASSSRNIIGNNCLFDATISYISTNGGEINKFNRSSQHLRDQCNKILESENLPIIPNGMPAGEQYLQAISKYFNAMVIVNFQTFSYNICHEDVDNDTKFIIKLRHVGSSLCGHWIEG